jgi:hypothetical protein
MQEKHFLLLEGQLRMNRPAKIEQQPQAQSQQAQQPSPGLPISQIRQPGYFGNRNSNWFNR